MIIIPLGGSGQRFKENTNIPKALIPVMGKPIIFWLLDNIQYQKIIIPYNHEYIFYDFEDLLKKRYPYIEFLFIPLEIQTKGAAETLKIGIEKYFETNSDDCPIFSIDSDNFYLENIVKSWNNQNRLIVFEDNQQNPIFSYVKVDNFVTEIKEKEKISNLANCGAYGFESIKSLYKYCCKIINENIKFKNEFYISTVISEMIKDGYKFTIEKIEKNKYISLGTPKQIEEFEKYNFLFDLDGTLVKTDDIYLKVWKEILQKYGLVIDDNFFVNFIKGKSDYNFLKFLIPDISLKEIEKISIEKDNKFIEIIEKEKPIIEINNANNFLNTIKNNNIAIITNCNRKSADFIVKYCGFDKYIKLLVAANDCKNSKPHPEPYQKAINYFNADLNKTVIFEDSETGYLSGKMCNIENIVLVINENTSYDLLKTDTIKINDFSNIDMNKILFKNFQKNNKYEEIIKNELINLPISNVKLNPVSLKTGYICDIKCYDLDYNGGNKETVVLKISNLDNELSKTATKLDMYNLEVYFYKYLSNIVGNFVNIPKCYGTIVDGEKKGIIMEDLRKHSGEFNINLEKNVKMLLKVVNKIYKMHSIYYFANEDELINVVKPLKKAKEITYYGELIRNRFEKFIIKNSIFLTNRENELLANIYKNFDKIQDELSTYPLSLCHGDLKSPNIFYKGNKTPYFLDWQYIHLNKGVSDIAFLMVESLKFDENICNLVLNYYFQLINEGKMNISREEYIRDFKNSLCNFPFFVCVWFNSEDSDKLLDKTFPLRFMKNLLKYYEYYL